MSWRGLSLPTLLTLGVAAVLLGCAVFAPLLVQHDPYVGTLSNRLLPPAWLAGGDGAHPLGTDVAMLAVAWAAIVGSTIGIIAGFTGGWLDAVLMRIVDLAISLPMILIALLVGVLVGPSLANIVVIIGLVLWSQFARMARNETLRISKLAYIDLARTAGLSAFRIVVEHIVPNIAGPLIVLATLQIGAVIIMEASLSFLGVGVPPPAPAWGTMIAEGRSYVVSAWWICIFPGAAVMLTVVVANLLGDGLTEALDPARRAERGP
jgi:peptide/nickel transport system permease protein